MHTGSRYLFGRLLLILLMFCQHKGDNQAKSHAKVSPVEVIKIKSKHTGVWSAAASGQDHSYTNDALAASKRRGRPHKNTSQQQIVDITAECQLVNSETSNISAENLSTLQDDRSVLSKPDPGLCDVVGESKKGNMMDDQHLALAAASLNADGSQVNQSYEVYGAMFPTSSDLDTMTTVIKPETSLIEEVEERFLQEVLLKSVIDGEDNLPLVVAAEAADDQTPAAVVVEKKRRGRPPGTVREKLIRICDFQDCGKSFRRLREFIDHYRTHTGDKPYVCDICGKTFVRSYAVTEHRRVHTGEKPYQCDMCGKQFSVGGDLTKHKRLHAGEVLYRCKLCGKEMNTGRENADHRRMHEGGIFCPHCGKSFTRLHNMKEHVRIAHTGDKNYVCRDCGKQFAYARNLRYHRRLHKSDRPFKCAACGKCFAGAGELGRHERSAHKTLAASSQIQVVYVTTSQQPIELIGTE